MLSWCLLFLFSGAWCKLYDRWRVAKFRLVPSSSANLCMSFAIEENPFLHAFHTLLFTRSGFSYILIFISLYSSSTVLSSHPPFISWKKQHRIGTKRVSPTILTDQLRCLSINALTLSQWPMLGLHGYVKTGKANCFLPWCSWHQTEGLSRLLRSFASTSLLQL